jgi:hypothetical protein
MQGLWLINEQFTQCSTDRSVRHSRQQVHPLRQGLKCVQKCDLPHTCADASSKLLASQQQGVVEAQSKQDALVCCAFCIGAQPLLSFRAKSSQCLQSRM